MICPYCRRDVFVHPDGTLEIHFRPGSAPPCPGSNQVPSRSARSLFDEDV